ncbi:MAG TPA: type IV pilin protein, partial [Immundisolibacter sp.]
SPDGYYSQRVFPLTSVSATAYNMEAQPIGRQAGDKCGTFAVNQSGNNVSGSYAKAACWK